MPRKWTEEQKREHGEKIRKAKRKKKASRIKQAKKKIKKDKEIDVWLGESKNSGKRRTLCMHVKKEDLEIATLYQVGLVGLESITFKTLQGDLVLKVSNKTGDWEEL